MKIIYNSIIPFKGFLAMNLFGFLFVREELKDKLDNITINHESIHTKQMKETLWIGFYIWYVIEWLIRVLFTKDRFSKKAYRNILFEQEAYNNERDLNYINWIRKPYAWIRKQATSK